LIVATLIAAALTAFAWRRRSTPGSLLFARLMLAVVTWSLGYTLELASADLPTAVLCAKAEYLGIISVPVLWLAFALQYTGHTSWVTHRNMLALACIPSITLLLTWTNELHGLIWREVRWDTGGPFAVMDVAYGAWFWVNTAYAYTALGLGSLLLVRSLLRAPQLYHGQAIVLMLGVGAPWIGNAVYLAGASPLPGVDLTPFAFTASGLAFTWGLFRSRLLDLVPTARDAVIESMSDGVVVLDMQSRIVDLNPAAQRMLGRTLATSIGQPVGQVLGARAAIVAHYRQVFESREEIVVAEAGAERVFDLSVSPLYDRGGHLSGRLAVWRDITEQKRAAEELRRARDAAESASRAKSAFLANMSHELRTPLTAILGYSELIETQTDPSDWPAMLSDLRRIQSASRHLLALISNILDFTSIETGAMTLHLEDLDVRMVVANLLPMVTPLAEKNGNTLEVHYGDGSWLVRADARKLHQVLLNLLGNAAKFTQHGAITLTIAHRTIDGGERLTFCVADTGIGMSQELLTRLFEPFTQADDSLARASGGAGIGLALSRQLCRLMGGDISVASEPGRGSVFSVSLPAVAGRCGAPVAGPAGGRRAGG
jgi:PAS domain S-box-containing protein